MTDLSWIIHLFFGDLDVQTNYKKFLVFFVNPLDTLIFLDWISIAAGMGPGPERQNDTGLRIQETRDNGQIFPFLCQTNVL